MSEVILYVALRGGRRKKINVYQWKEIFVRAIPDIGSHVKLDIYEWCFRVINVEHYVDRNSTIVVAESNHDRVSEVRKISRLLLRNGFRLPDELHLFKARE